MLSGDSPMRTSDLKIICKTNAAGAKWFHKSSVAFYSIIDFLNLVPYNGTKTLAIR